MPVLYQGELHVHYGQFYVESRREDFFDGLTEAFGGQHNGLCGAAVPGLLFLITGLHTGGVPVTVERFDAPPPVPADWEEIVEVPYRPATEAVHLVGWAAEASWPLAVPLTDLRVRYCASGMDQARQIDTRLAGEPMPDRYLLQCWPAPPAPDEVLRRTSEIAGYWHSRAATLPAPQPRQRDEARRREHEALLRARAARAAETRHRGSPPAGV